MIVTGFVDLEPYESLPRAKPSSGYIESARWLLGADAPMVIFSEPHLRPALWRLRPAGSITLWQDAVVPEHDPRIETGLARSRFAWNKAKDTPRYFGLMRQKIEWLARGAAVAQAPVTWVDMALAPGNTNESPRMFLDGRADRIRVAELSYVPRSVRNDRALFYLDHYWPVAGGVIRGSPGDLQWLNERVEEEWQWCLSNGYAATDEMMLGFIRFAHPERFEVYYSDHPTLVANWRGVRASHRLIMQMALRALDDGSPEEARGRLEALAASAT